MIIYRIALFILNIFSNFMVIFNLIPSVFLGIKIGKMFNIPLLQPIVGIISIGLIYVILGCILAWSCENIKEKVKEKLI